MSSKNKITKEEAENIIKDCYSIADFCRKVGWEPRGDNYKIFHKYVKIYNLDISHFTGIKTNIGNKNNINIKLSVKDYIKNKDIVRGSTLVKKLIEEGYKINECECCHNSEWLGKPIKLELHHIDGNQQNNTIENFQLLCPNCHAYTDNYRGNKNKKDKTKYCKNCGKEISKWSKSGLCQDCAHKKQYKVEHPPKDKLEIEILTNSYEALGRKYGVSGRTIKKWCIKFGIAK